MTHPRPAPPSGADAERAAFLRDLRALRDQAGLRPQELAARAHFPEETLTSAEAGPALPSLPVLQAYVRGCGAGAGSAEWEDRWRRLTQDPDVETALPTRAPTVSRAPAGPAGPFGPVVGTGSANPAEQAAIGFGLARVAASLSPAGAGTSSWFSRADLEQPESASTPPASYPPPSYPPTPAAPAAPAPASPASSMPESLTTWRPGTRETWGQEQQPGLDRRPGPRPAGWPGPAGRPGPAGGPGPAGWFRAVVGSGRAACPVRSGLAGRPGRFLAGAAVRDFGLLPRSGSARGVLSGAPAGWSSVRDTAVGLRPVGSGGCPAPARRVPAGRPGLPPPRVPGRPPVADQRSAGRDQRSAGRDQRSAGRDQQSASGRPG